MRLDLIAILILLFGITSANAQMDEQFYHPSKQMNTIEWENKKEFSLLVENDTITGIILKPLTKPKATILFFHGTGGNISTYMFMTLPLVQNNYQVVMVDFRGYGKSTGKPSHINIANDGQYFFDSILKNENIKNTKIILYGASMGSQIATHLAKNNQERIKALILDGAMASFTDIAIYYTPKFKEVLEKTYKSPYAAKEDIKQLTNIKKLFIHSKDDVEVPFEQGRIVFDNATEPKRFIEYSGAHLKAIQLKTNEVLNAINDLIE